MMSMRDALLADILDHPDEDAPRLVYADWLEDEDDPRGEFIHVQCWLAGFAGEGPERRALEARARELLDRYQDEWLGPLRPLLCRWTFRRGFLDTVIVPAATYLARPVPSWPVTVRRVEVELSGFEVPPDVLAFVPESVARESDLLPLGFRDETIVLAMHEPHDLYVLEKLRFILNRDVEAVAAPAGAIAEAINGHYGDGAWLHEVHGPFPYPPLPRDDVGPRSAGEEQQASDLVRRALVDAISYRATELHIESRPDHVLVRYLIDGALVAPKAWPRRLLEPILAMLRLGLGMWKYDQRDEQAGRREWTLGGNRLRADVLIRREGDGWAAVVTFSWPGREAP